MTVSLLITSDKVATLAHIAPGQIIFVFGQIFSNHYEKLFAELFFHATALEFSLLA